MLQSYEDETLSLLLRVRPMREQTVEELEEERRRRQEASLILSHGDEKEQSKPSTVKRTEDKVGRNDPCPCGSGKKYKKCCGAKKK
jgi:preprotein translocase subunit SecA